MHEVRLAPTVILPAPDMPLKLTVTKPMDTDAQLNSDPRATMAPAIAATIGSILVGSNDDGRFGDISIEFGFPAEDDSPSGG
jgi:hypothetical protein